MGTFGGESGPIYFDGAVSFGIDRIQPDGTGHEVLVPSTVQIGGRVFVRPGSPSISADGRSVVFHAVEISRSILMKTDVESGVTEPLNFGAGEIEGSSPTWAPDGSRVAFVRHLPAAGGRTREFLVIADKNGEHAALDLGLPPTIFDAQLPQWSPDGRWIAVSVLQQTGENDLMLVDANDPQRTTTLLEAFPSTCSWHPDSTRLVVSLETLGIHVVEIDSNGGRVGLTRLEGSEGTDSMPVYAPGSDGTNTDTVLVHVALTDGAFVLITNGRRKDLQVRGFGPTWGVTARPRAAGRVHIDPDDVPRRPSFENSPFDGIRHRIRRLLGRNR